MLRFYLLVISFLIPFVSAFSNSLSKKEYIQLMKEGQTLERLKTDIGELLDLCRDYANELSKTSRFLNEYGFLDYVEFFENQVRELDDDFVQQGLPFVFFGLHSFDFLEEQDADAIEKAREEILGIYWQEHFDRKESIKRDREPHSLEIIKSLLKKLSSEDEFFKELSLYLECSETHQDFLFLMLGQMGFLRQPAYEGDEDDEIEKLQEWCQEIHNINKHYHSLLIKLAQASSLQLFFTHKATGEIVYDTD